MININLRGVKQELEKFIKEDNSQNNSFLKHEIYLKKSNRIMNYQLSTEHKNSHLSMIKYIKRSITTTSKNKIDIKNTQKYSFHHLSGKTSVDTKRNSVDSIYENRRWKPNPNIISNSILSLSLTNSINKKGILLV